MIEIKVNNEIRSVKSDIVGGFSLYEVTFFAIGFIVGCGLGIFLYFKGVPIGVVAYLAVFLMAPFALLGQLTYHEMTCLQLVKTLVKQNQMPRVLTYGSSNYYYMKLKEYQARKRKEARKHHGPTGYFKTGIKRTYPKKEKKKTA